MSSTQSPGLSVRRLIAACAMLVLAANAGARTVVLGFDGLDPALTERWMADGTLPHLKRLAEQGHYQELHTTNPAQSPVAWASFATGQNPGEHGIFDFIRRDAAGYRPDFSISEVREPESHLEAFGYRIPLEEGEVRSRRVGKPFWVSAEQRGSPSSVLRVPVTYPPDRIHRMLAGMGVPDLLGTQGTFTFYTSRFSEHHSEGGRVVRVKPDGGRIETTFEGPAHPLATDGSVLSVPLSLSDTGEGTTHVDLDGRVVELRQGEWSDWVPVAFRFAGALTAEGMVRFHLVEGFPRPSLYVSPINIDPREPAIPISSPEEYAEELAARIGPYHTLGMPEETWSLNERRISDDAYLAMIETVLREREAMLFDTLDQNDSELVVAVFVQTDRVSHMFWRGLDAEHPLHEKTSDKGKDAIRWIYAQADRIVGETLARLQPNDRLIVLSDHGFADFRRVVHLNRWLQEEGFLALKPGADTAGVAFSDVDWSRTKAYALGLNGIYLNLQGRESEGSVAPQETAALKRAIQARLTDLADPASGEPIIDSVYLAEEIYAGEQVAHAPDLVVGYRKGFRASWQTVLGAAPQGLVADNEEKWSGDHCIAPHLVPGVLFASFPVDPMPGSIMDVAQLVLDGLPTPAQPAGAGEPPAPGVFDRASPLFSAVRPAIAWLPLPAEILLWSLLGAYASMRLYRLLSNQHELRLLKPEIGKARRALAAYDGEFSGLWPLIGRNYRLAGRHLWLTFTPALISSIPLLFLLAWISNEFDARLPAPGEQVEVVAHPERGFLLPGMRWEGGVHAAQSAPGHWLVDWPVPGGEARLVEHDGSVLLKLPLDVPVGTVHQELWWNMLFSNPLGYLPSPGVVERIDIGVPTLNVIDFGPAWMRGWPLTFFVGLVGFSLLLKRRWRLH